MNGQPLNKKKQVQLLIALTILAWATQTLLHQWGFGQEIPLAMVAQPHENFVPQSTLVAGSGTMEMRDAATVSGGEIKLKQVCRWSDTDATGFLSIADLTVDRFSGNGTNRLITLDQIRSTLRDAGVNTATIRFAGAAECAVTRSDLDTDSQQALKDWATKTGGDTAVAALASAKNDSEKPGEKSVGGNSLRDLLVADVSQRLNIPTEQLQVFFEPKDAAVLNLSDTVFHFELMPRRVRNLGEVLWDVKIGGGKSPQRVTITATARAWQSQVIANRPMAYNEVVREDDITEKRVLVDHISEEPLLTKSQVLGQQAARDLKPGAVMTARTVDPVQLAKNGQYITVILNAGSVQVKTVAKAMEAGNFGQSIHVKNEETRDVYTVTLTGPQTAVMNVGAQ